MTPLFRWPLLLSIIDIRIRESPFTLCRFATTKQTKRTKQMRVKREATMAWHTLISGLGLIAWARGHATASEERTEERAQAAEGLLLHWQQQVSACATTVVSMSQMGYHGRRTKHRRIFWRLKIAGYRCGRPRVPRWAPLEPFALS